MRKHFSFHTPAFVWVFLAGLCFFDFTYDRANDNATSVGKQHSNFEKHVDSLYKVCDLKKNSLDKYVFEKAMVGYYNIKAGNDTLLKKNIISVVDFTKKSTEKRLWIIDLSKAKLLFHTLVAHGKNTGDQYATTFSNNISSDMSSLGFYITGEIYNGKHGMSLVLDGLDKGFNDNARQRGVVMHAADYVSEDFINSAGRLGRSFGCPAIPTELTPEIVNTISDGSCLFIYYPNKAYEQTTTFYNTSTAIKSFEQ